MKALSLWPRLALATLGMALLIQLGTPIPDCKGADIHPHVERRLAAADANESVSAILVMREQADVPNMLSALRLRRASRQERHFVVLRGLQETARTSQSLLLSQIETMKEAGSVHGYTPYWISNLVVVSGTPDAIRVLSQHPDVRALEPNIRPRLIEPVETRPVSNARARFGIVPEGLRAIRADKVWYELGVTGAGTIVACLDTGVQASHPALRDRWVGDRTTFEAGWLDLTGDHASVRPRDVHGHGTHVIGTMCGLSTDFADTIGVAWGASWMASNAVSPQTNSANFDNDVLRSFQWFADPDGNPATVDDIPDVVQNSWGVAPDEGYVDCDTHWWGAIDNCEAAGVVVTFSAGNDGPIPNSIISPADRATTSTNAFSVGAVSAASANGYPYRIAGFSSRGPSECPTGDLIKPEVVAPGVDVLSSWPNEPTGYRLASGTSMAGPHAAGVVALMREVNPELHPEEVKTILMQTAQRYGPTEDNTYGWGFIDAYEAVLAAAGMRSLGLTSGLVTDDSPEQVPVTGAEILFVDGGGTLVTNRYGRFSGFIPLGAYRVEVSHPLLETIVFPEFLLEVGTPEYFEAALGDRTGPRVGGLLIDNALVSEDDSVTVRALVQDYTGIEDVDLVHREVDGTFQSLPMHPNEFEEYEAQLPHLPLGSELDIYIATKDPLGNLLTYPPDGASGPMRIDIQRAFLWDNAELDQGWTFGEEGDSRDGTWVREDPFGTTWFDEQVEPADDHSRNGTQCFVTGHGRRELEPDQRDVDGGCVTLLSPWLDLGEARAPALSYWRWFAAAGFYGEAQFTAEVTGDGGETWIEIESLSSGEPQWTEMRLDLDDIVDITGQARLRFRACDFGEDTLVEAAIDDVMIRASVPRTDPEGEDPPITAIVDVGPVPNPFQSSTEIRFRLDASERVEVAIFDASGRRVRSFREAEFEPGEHAFDWDGRDDTGRNMTSGVYYYVLDGERLGQRGRIVLVR